MLTNAAIGAALMGASVVWLVWAIVTLNRAIAQGTAHIHIGPSEIGAAVVAVLCFIAGRFVAGKSFIDLVIGG